MISYHDMPSPLGRLRLVADDDGLRAVEFEQARYPLRPQPDWRAQETPILRETRRQLDAYFAGERRRFDLPLAAPGTDFQKSVWRALCGIEYGQTCSYRELAQRLGAPSAMRAVGAANGRNPIAIVVPCHRVIGADGSLTGYAGGLARKQQLLALEGALSAAPEALHLQVGE